MRGIGGNIAHPRVDTDGQRQAVIQHGKTEQRPAFAVL